MAGVSSGVLANYPQQCNVTFRRCEYLQHNTTAILRRIFASSQHTHSHWRYCPYHLSCATIVHMLFPENVIQNLGKKIILKRQSLKGAVEAGPQTMDEKRQWCLWPHCSPAVECHLALLTARHLVDRDVTSTHSFTNTIPREVSQHDRQC